MKKISNFQFSVVVINFILGSAILFPLGIKAKQDAYFVILIGMIIGIILSLIYTKINSLYPDQTLIQINQKIFGTYIGWLFGFIYTKFFIYIAGRNTRDLAEQVTHFIVGKRDIDQIIILIIGIIIYATYYNLETIIRVIVIIAPYVVLTLIIINFYLLTFNADFSGLKPILVKGFKPILKEVYPGITAFPFAELAVFMIIIPHINGKKSNIKKQFILGIVIASLLITMNTIMMITTLGSTLAEQVTFPLIKSGQLAQGELTNFDFFISLATVLTLTTKLFILTYTGIQGSSELFNINYKKQLSLFL